jgi:hypothetical protein
MKMKTLKMWLICATFASIGAIVVSCEPDPTNELDGKGISLMRFAGLSDKFQLVSITPEPQAVSVGTIKRDAISSAQLGQAASVDFVLDQAVLDKYNTDNQTEFTMLDPASYTFVGSSSKIEFAAGEDVKDITIQLDPSGLDLSLQYALAFIIKNPTSPYKLSVGADTAVVQVIIKNQYDGIYHSIGTRFNFGAAGDYTGWDDVNQVATGNIVSTGPWEFDTPMSTRGASTVNVHVGNSNGGFGYLNVTVNPDNTVTVASSPETKVNALLPLPGKTSTYDPVTKTFVLYYQYTNTSGTFRVLYDVLVKK